MRYLFIITLFGCSTSTPIIGGDALPNDGAIDTFDGAVFVDALADADAAVASDAGDDAFDAFVCEADFAEPDDGAPRVTFEAVRMGGRPAYAETWEGTWFSDGFDDVDRLQLNVGRALAEVVVPEDQVWVGAATDARRVELVVTCTEGDFIGCDRGRQDTPQSCFMMGADTVTIGGHCSRGAAVLNLAAWQDDDAPCERSLRVEIVH